MSNVLKNACRKKNHLYRLFLRDRTEISESRYKTYTNKLTSILRSIGKAYYSKLVAEKKGHIKETWAILNTVIRKQCTSIKYPIHIKCGDKDISNKFFTNITSKLAENITNSDGNFSINDYLGGMIGNCLYLKPVDEEEVINTVKTCTRKKSTDFEDTSMDIVANVIPVISKPLTHICNNSFKTGTFPLE